LNNSAATTSDRRSITETAFLSTCDAPDGIGMLSKRILFWRLRRNPPRRDKDCVKFPSVSD
jgi:hypothetical protein